MCAVGSRSEWPPLGEMTNGGVRWARPLMGTRSEPVMKKRRRLRWGSSNAWAIWGGCWGWGWGVVARGLRGGRVEVEVEGA